VLLSQRTLTTWRRGTRYWVISQSEGTSVLDQATWPKWIILHFLSLTKWAHHIAPVSKVPNLHVDKMAGQERNHRIDPTTMPPIGGRPKQGRVCSNWTCKSRRSIAMVLRLRMQNQITEFQSWMSLRLQIQRKMKLRRTCKKSVSSLSPNRLCIMLLTVTAFRLRILNSIRR